ncbi:MAG: SWIM zinc finger family protein, partial [Bacteroidales bacterium]|nr:SWIM zinc finger family protein [Bacteroidales bacterium]
TTEYGIEFYVENDSVQSTCNCPYDGVCKHTVAALLYIVNEGIDHISTYALNSPTASQSLDFLRKYLESFTKEELISLVVKFAPENFIMEIKNREETASNAEEIFRKADKKIRKLFEDEDLLYDPSGMEQALLSQLNKLKGLEARLPVEIGELILFIIRGIDAAFDDGYLYIDNYYGDEYFESEEFCDYVISYVKQLPFKAKTGYLTELDQALNEMSYSTFATIQESYHRVFSDHEREDVKTLLKPDGEIATTIISRLYKFLEPVLSPDEKEIILRTISSSDADHFLSFCVQLSGQNRYPEVIDLIKDDSIGFKMPVPSCTAW